MLVYSSSSSYLFITGTLSQLPTAQRRTCNVSIRPYWFTLAVMSLHGNSSSFIKPGSAEGAMALLWYLASYCSALSDRNLSSAYSGDGESEMTEHSDDCDRREKLSRDVNECYPSGDWIRQRIASTMIKNEAILADKDVTIRQSARYCRGVSSAGR